MNQLSVREDNLPDTVDAAEAGQYLTFYVGGERFAIGILDVQEIIEVVNITRVPMMPEHIRGVLNLRGNVVPVVDLAARLGHTRSEITKRSCIVLTEVSHDETSQIIGMLVDEVNEILEIPKNALQPAPDFGASIRTDFIQYMGRIDDDFIILLDVNHVLSVQELGQLEQMRRQQASSA